MIPNHWLIRVVDRQLPFAQSIHAAVLSVRPHQRGKRQPSTRQTLSVIRHHVAIDLVAARDRRRNSEVPSLATFFSLLDS